MSCQHTSNHSHVLTVPQSTFCESPAAASTPLVDSHLHSHHHHHQSHHLQQSLLLSRFQRRGRGLPLRQTVSAQQLSPPSPPPRHQRHQQIKQQQLQLKIREQLEQQSLQKQQWQQQAQQWQQCQKCLLQQHQHHDHGNVPRLTVNDSGASNLASNLQRHVSLGSFPSSFSPSQQRQSAEVKTRSLQQEYEYLTLQVQQNDKSQYTSQFSQQYQQYQQRSAYKLFDEPSASKDLFSQDAPARESDAMAPTTSFSYFNHNSLKEQSTLLSELSLDFLTGFEQFSLDGEIDFLKNNESRKEDKVKTFSYFTAQPNVNFVQPTIVCSTNIDYFVNPLEAAPDICQDARPGSAYYKISISTRSGAALNDSKDCKDKSATERSLCGLNKLQVFSEIQNLELLTSPKFNDFPQDLKEYLLSERMILADVRSIIASEHSDTLQSCDENNEKKTTEETPSSENKTYANILQSVPQYDLNSSPTSDEHSCDMKPLPATRRHNRRSKSTNSRHNVNNLKNGIKKSNHSETSNSASALEKRKRTKVPYKFRKQSSNNKNPKIYNDSWRVDALSGKKRN